MGQKINPIGLRIGIVQKAKSQWFAPRGFADESSSGHTRTGTYALFLHQDKIVRDFLSTELRDAGLSKVLISRRRDRLALEVFVAQPKVILSENGTRFTALLEKVKKCLERANRSCYSDQPVPAISLQITQVSQEEVSTDAMLIAQKIQEQLERRIPYRKAVKQAIIQARTAGVKGIKIQIAGRLNGAEIARAEHVKEGSIPLQTLRANIDYISHEANTIYGILGIKVWVYNGI